MKKFLIFLVAIITAVCIGVTFYQFAKNDEVIKVNTQTIYINYGDKLTLDDIGFIRKEASKETKINFNAGGDEVASIIKYDELSGCYIPTAKGGSTTIKITTTNRKYKSFSIDVVVGIGSEEHPYYISNEKQLFNITNAHIDDNACFELVNDIELTETHKPIGLIEDGYREFTGKINGNYHTISNLKIENCENAGLIAIMGSNSQVYNLNISNAVINGSFTNIGTVAGICYGNINKVVVSNATITNTKENTNTGAVVGLLATDDINGVTAGLLRTYAYTDQDLVITGNGNIGGLVGKIDSAIMHACYSKLNLVNSSDSKSATTGGLVGILEVDPNTYIRESYAVNKITAKGIIGNVIGKTSLSKDVSSSDLTKELVLVGIYFETGLNEFKGIGSDVAKLSTATSFAVNGKSNDEMKIKTTYVYYVNSDNNIVYWDKVWYLVDGEYPTLTFVNKFDDIVLENGSLPTLPDDPSSPDISNPDLDENQKPNASAVIIASKEELIEAFQTKKNVKGTFILNADIDLGGINWTPVNFSGTFKSSTNKNHTISNFTIVGDNIAHAGFFYNIVASTINNITFSNVKLTSTTNLETAGIVAGLIRGNAVVKNVNVINAQISTTKTKYTGGIAGYIENIITKIEKCTIQGLTINETSLNVGGIAGYVSKEAYILACKVKNYNTLKGIDRIGGISAVNHGTIYDCYFNGYITSIEASNAGYFGGLVGVNYAQLLYSSTFAEINVNNPSSINSGIYYFVGGMAGYNIGKIENCCAYADEYNAKTSTGVVYLAGLTAYNTGSIKYCVSDVLSIGSVNKTNYSAGLTVFNYGGSINVCFAFGNLNGYQVAGLVRTNANNGIVDSCMTGLNDIDLATYKGVQVTSFAYDISSGSISNCLVNANLNCTSQSGWIAGFAGFMSYTNGKFGTISYSIANVTFNGVGINFLDIAQDGLMKKSRTTGTITNCVISENARVKDVVVSEYSTTLWVKQEPASGSNYIVVSNDQIVNIDTYLEPNSCNFDIGVGLTDSSWLYINNTRLPIPRAYLEVFGYDIIGLG
ncbi:MAG: hypothetical protein ACLRFE_04600 [Clostridia bacterium]